MSLNKKTLLLLVIISLFLSACSNSNTKNKDKDIDSGSGSEHTTCFELDHELSYQIAQLYRYQAPAGWEHIREDTHDIYVYNNISLYMNSLTLNIGKDKLSVDELEEYCNELLQTDFIDYSITKTTISNSREGFFNNQYINIEGSMRLDDNIYWFIAYYTYRPYVDIDATLLVPIYTLLMIKDENLSEITKQEARNFLQEQKLTLSHNNY